MANQPTRFTAAQESKPNPSPGIRITLILEVATVPIENEIEAVRALEVVGRHDVLHLTTTASAMLGECFLRL
jgi:hypothetical protein